MKKQEQEEKEQHRSCRGVCKRQHVASRALQQAHANFKPYGVPVCTRCVKVITQPLLVGNTYTKISAAA
jgi:hypothetical protein